MLKKILVIILVYLMTIPINYIPYISAGVLQAKKYRVTIIDINAEGDVSFSKRMSQFIKDELETKNRIEFFEHGVNLEVKAKPKKEKVVSKREYDNSVFSDIAELQESIEQQKADGENVMLIESWLQVIEVYEENFENLENMQVLFEAYLQKSFYEGLEQLDKEAKDNLRQAIAIGRNLVFDSSKFSPRFLVKYNRERKRGKKKAKASFKLDAPSSHELVIDGISMGKAPVKVTNLSYGKHFVVVLDNHKVVKKQIVELTKRKKYQTMKLESKVKKEVKKELVTNEEKTDSQILTLIDEKLFKNELDTDLKDSLADFAKKINADFIILGNSTKKHDLYTAKLYIYNANNKEISSLTKGEFDTDLLTGDVEGLRIGNEVVKGVDNFSTLKTVKLTKKEVKKEKKVNQAALRTVSFLAYEKLDFSNKAVKVTVKDTKKDENSIDLAKMDTIDTKDTKKDTKKIDLADADYSDLDSDLNKYDEPKEDKDGAWYSKWWVWTIVGAVVIGGTAGTVYVLNKNGDSTPTTIPSGTW